MQRLTNSRLRLFEKRHLAFRIFSTRNVASLNAEATDETSSASAAPIVMPKKINRSPTDLLRALSETVGIDPTMPHYKYHDDPFLIPESFNQRTRYAMSEESGRKAARWIVNEHGDLFNVSK